MNEEKKRILKMIEDGTITSEEGLKLLEAIDTNSERINVKTADDKWIRIRIVDGESKVNVNLPFKLVQLGMQIGNNFVPDNKNLQNIDFEEIITLVENGAMGKLVEIEDGDATVKIYVE